MQIQTQERTQQKRKSRNILCHFQVMQIDGTRSTLSSASDSYFAGTGITGVSLIDFDGGVKVRRRSLELTVPSNI
jgi:hypothetical protein